MPKLTQRRHGRYSLHLAFCSLQAAHAVLMRLPEVLEGASRGIGTFNEGASADGDCSGSVDPIPDNEPGVFSAGPEKCDSSSLCASSDSITQSTRSGKHVEAVERASSGRKTLLLLM